MTREIFAFVGRTPPRNHLTATLVAFALACWPIPAMGLQPPSDRREDLMDQLGVPSEPPDKAPPDAASPADDGSTAPTEPSPSITFSGRIRKQLAADCGSCHASGGVAGNTRYVISGSLDADYRIAKQLVSTSDPKASILLRKASGDGHAGGTTYPVGSAKYKTLLQWIEGGAIKGSSGDAKRTPTPSLTPDGSKPKPELEPAPKADEAPTALYEIASDDGHVRDQELRSRLRGSLLASEPPN